MHYTQKQFNDFLVQKGYRKNQEFKANPENLQRIVQNIKNMQVQKQSFEKTQFLIKEFRISILMCFRPFYNRIQKEQKWQQFKAQVKRIASLVWYNIKPYTLDEYPQLEYFFKLDRLNKGFVVKQSNQQQKIFLAKLKAMKKFIKSEQHIPSVSQQIENEQLKFQNQKQISLQQVDLETNSKAASKADSNKNQSKVYVIQVGDFTVFQKFYIKQVKEFFMQIYNSIKYPSKKDKANESATEHSRNFMRFRNNPQIIKIKDHTQIINKVDDGNQADLSAEMENPDNLNQGNIKTIVRYDADVSNLNITTELDCSKIVSRRGRDYSKIELNQRTFFFFQQKILKQETLRVQYKSYRFPFTPPSYETLKKTICGFLNAEGGQIYLGVKQTTDKKDRFVIGSCITQNEKEEMRKSFRKISENIFPNRSGDLDVDFIPLRQSPHKDVPLKIQKNKYFYDFSDWPNFSEQDYPFLPAQYVVRVIVPEGRKNQMHSYLETEYVLNINAQSKEFVAIRVQSQVLVKEMGQQILEKYRDRLRYGKQQEPNKYGPYAIPQIGDPRIQPQSEKKKLDEVFSNSFKTTSTEQTEIKKQKKQDSSNVQKASQKPKMQKEKKKDAKEQSKQKTVKLGELFANPLNFIITQASEEKMIRVINKTPAKTYTKIQTIENSIDKKPLVMIRVSNYAFMQEFLKIKKKIEDHFRSNQLKIIGVSKKMQVRKQDYSTVLSILKGHKVDYVDREKDMYFQFYSLNVAASYFAYFQSIKFSVEAIPD